MNEHHRKMKVERAIAEYLRMEGFDTSDGMAHVDADCDAQCGGCEDCAEDCEPKCDGASASFNIAGLVEHLFREGIVT